MAHGQVSNSLIMRDEPPPGLLDGGAIPQYSGKTEDRRFLISTDGMHRRELRTFIRDLKKS